MQWRYSEKFQLFVDFRIVTIDLEEDLDYELEIDVEMDQRHEDALLDDNGGKMKIRFHNLRLITRYDIDMKV